MPCLWLTSLLYRAVGHRTFAAVLLQCAIGALVPLLLAAFGRSFFGDPLGRWSGWIAAVHPLLVFFSGERALGVGLAWGVAALTRHTAILLPAIVAAWAWQPLGPTLGGRARARQVGLILLGLAVVVGPWTLRDAVALRAFVPVTTGAGGAMMVANNPPAWDDPVARGGANSTTYRAALAGEFRGLNEVQVDARARARAWAFILSRSRGWPAVAMAKRARFWRPGAEGGGPGSWQRPGSPLAAVLRLDPLFAWSVLALPFALRGVARWLRGGRRWFQALPLLVILNFMRVAVVFFGSLRMRLPVEPLVALFVALGLEDARRRLQARRRGLTVVPGRGGATLSPGER